MKASPRENSLLILMRHGESVWNQKNLFTGWVDVPLSKKGVEEALQGGRKIQNIPIDVIFTSSLVRAHMTLFLAMLSHTCKKTPVFVSPDKKRVKWAEIHSRATKEGVIPVYSSWRLNERMYGKLQGLNKEATRKKYGKKQVEMWRRSFSIAPPSGESLEDTANRALPYFFEKIEPFLRKKKNVFLSAHGNSLRAILMKLEDFSEEQILGLEIPTGEPIIYRYLKGKYKREDGNIF